MGLAEYQQALARLYTNPADRRAFFADPSGVGQAWALDADDISRIQQIPRAKIEAFGRSLVAKRRGEVERILPETCAALGEALRPLFVKHAEAFVPTGLRKHDADASAFARFLLDRNRAPHPHPVHGARNEEITPEVVAAARWELAVLEVRRSGHPRIVIQKRTTPPGHGSKPSRKIPFLLSITLLWPARNGGYRAFRIGPQEVRIPAPEPGMLPSQQALPLQPRKGGHADARVRTPDLSE